MVQTQKTLVLETASRNKKPAWSLGISHEKIWQIPFHLHLEAGYPKSVNQSYRSLESLLRIHLLRGNCRIYRIPALNLREAINISYIIYVTSHEEMMEAAFGRNVIAFVRKTGNWDKLTEVLQNFQREHQRLIDVTWKKKVWQIDVSQILYIQSADNYSQITFYLRGEVVQALQTYTMKEWEQILQEQGFCRISRFVIVNYAYVEDIQKTSLIMEDSMRFNIPNGKVRRLRQEYIAYAREHERVL